jgi:NADPH-dependent ferric siderophore reductase
MAADAGDSDATLLAPRLRTHLTHVARVEHRTPRVRRITFAGGDLATFEPLDAPDQFLYLLLPPPGRDELTIDASFTWEGFYLMPEADQPVGAYYTVRHHRPARAAGSGGAGLGEIDIDMVLHEPAGHGSAREGASSAWAERARPGDPVALWGPRTTFTPPRDPGEPVDWWLLVADDTGLPAAAAILDWLPPDATAHVIVEVADEDERIPLGGGPGVQVQWLYRGPAPAGTTTALVDAVRSLALPPGRPYVWGGAESRTMAEIRRYLRREVGYPRERVSLTPYWRHAAHAGDPDDEEA